LESERTCKLLGSKIAEMSPLMFWRAGRMRRGDDRPGGELGDVVEIDLLFFTRFGRVFSLRGKEPIEEKREPGTDGGRGDPDCEGGDMSPLHPPDPI